jgi:ATP-dependent DNA helicase RecG
MDVIKLLDMIRIGESDSVEFKRSPAPDCAKNIVAFLNTGGGTIIFGIDDDGTIVGMKGQGDLHTFAQSIDPQPYKQLRWEEIQIEDKRLGILQVDKSSHLHTYRNVAYVRMGAMSKPLSIEELVEKASESILIRFDQMPNPQASVSDFDQGLVDHYFQKRKGSRNISVPDADLVHSMMMIGAAGRSNSHIVPTNAGILFFFRDPQSVFMQASVRVVVFRDDTMDETLDTGIFGGPMDRMVEESMAFIDRYVPLRSGLEKGALARTTRKAYPLLAIRESLINSVTHRNYLDMADTRVFIFPDRIEIVNAGGFPPGVDPDEPIHKPRNALISQYFYDLGYVERYGSGIRKMIAACLDMGLSPPRFQIREFETKVIFCAEQSYEGRILALIKQKGYSTSGDLAASLGISRDTVNRNLKVLLEAGKIFRTGNGRGTKYTPNNR